MKTFLCFVLGVLLTLRAGAQEGDPLSATLPSGRVIHFETEEQRTKFLAARERLAAASTTPAPAPAALSNTAVAPGVGQTAADATPQMNGKVNVNAPTFTAEYYLFAPETWEGKQITVSVAYIRREDSSRADGLVELRANTYGKMTATGGQEQGGYIMIVATPAAAERISSLAGTRYQYGVSGTKTTLFKGVFKRSGVGSKGYYIYVDK